MALWWVSRAGAHDRSTEREVKLTISGLPGGSGTSATTKEGAYVEQMGRKWSIDGLTRPRFIPCQAICVFSIQLSTAISERGSLWSGHRSVVGGDAKFNHLHVNRICQYLQGRNPALKRWGNWPWLARFPLPPFPHNLLKLNASRANFHFIRRATSLN